MTEIIIERPSAAASHERTRGHQRAVHQALSNVRIVKANPNECSTQVTTDALQVFSYFNVAAAQIITAQPSQVKS
ncbi:hypothetical protein [Roseobacter sp. N2S]|uniref:hypothetical protein n=1 Tax=Roseobacter sp. N2S TaxID=2663844 RepID=UPI002860D2CC|nr:hypothetical protein [Roseobacter sp. N2S]MDR6266391.1 hypothetical protein [Roseobacter sp. N2S]